MESQRTKARLPSNSKFTSTKVDLPLSTVRLRILNNFTRIALLFAAETSIVFVRKRCAEVTLKKIYARFCKRATMSSNCGQTLFLITRHGQTLYATDSR